MNYLVCRTFCHRNRQCLFKSMHSLVFVCRIIFEMTSWALYLFIHWFSHCNICKWTNISVQCIDHFCCSGLKINDFEPWDYNYLLSYWWQMIIIIYTDVIPWCLVFVVLFAFLYTFLHLKPTTAIPMSMINVQIMAYVPAATGWCVINTN